MDQFPIEVYPDVVQRFIKEASSGIGCSIDYLAAGVLPIIGTALGSDVRLWIGEGWIVRPVFWVALVGESGTKKNPAIAALDKPIRDKDVALGKMNFLLYNSWKYAPQKERGPKPPQSHLHTTDPTIEGLRDVLIENPKGLLLSTGELSGWIDSFCQYKGGKGKDRAQWLDIYSGAALKALRAGKEFNATVPNPFVNILGGIQPALLSKLSGDDGFQARVFFAFGERVTVAGLPRYSNDPDSDNASDVGQGYSDWNRLIKLILDSETRKNGALLRLDDDARTLADSWYVPRANELCFDVKRSSEWNEACRKMLEGVFRIAIGLWILDIATGAGGVNDLMINEDQIGRAVVLADHFLSVVETLDVDRSSNNDREWVAKIENLRKFLVKNPNCNRSMMLTKGPVAFRKASQLNEGLKTLGWSEIPGTNILAPSNEFIKQMKEAGSLWDRYEYARKEGKDKGYRQP